MQTPALRSRGELRSRMLSLCGAAVAVVLSAHLLSEPTWHRGSILDIGLLFVAVFSLRIGGGKMRGQASIVTTAGIAALVAVLWPFLELDRHGAGSEVVTSLLWVLAVAVTFVCGLSIFARESLQVIRAIVAIARLRGDVPAEARVFAELDAALTLARTWADSISRRGPPAAALEVPLRT
jgi:hypothetical protein